MNSPLISVIIPCYRQGHYLPMALESVFRQTYPSIETIVVNDGSDDDTGAVAASYGNRVRYLMKNNGGLASARNAGIRVANGRYLLFLDADDFLHAEAIGRLVSAMNGRANTVCIMGWREFQGNNIAAGVDCQVAPGALLPRLIQANLAPPHCYLSSKRMVVDVGGFYEHFEACGCEDWDLWLRLALSGAEEVVVSFPGAYYRRYLGSMSTNSERMLKSRTEVLLRAHNNIASNQVNLSRWGQDLYQAEHRIRRRWICKRGPSFVHLLTANLHQLERRGFHLHGSLLTRLVNTLFGVVGERMAMACLHRIAPKSYACYANGIL